MALAIMIVEVLLRFEANLVDSAYLWLTVLFALRICLPWLPASAISRVLDTAAFPPRKLLDRRLAGLLMAGLLMRVMLVVR